MILKKSYLTQLSYEVTEAEKFSAKKILLCLSKITKKLNIAKDQLDLVYFPFKNKPDISPEEVFKNRAQLRNYRDQVIDSFNEIKILSFHAYTLMQPFSFDTQIIKIMNSFVMAIGDVEKQVNRFAELFMNMDSKEFIPTVITAIDNIKKEVSQLEQIIEDRVESHIKNNILASTWVDTVGNKLQKKIEQKTPLIKQLVEEREKEFVNNKSNIKV